MMDNNKIDRHINHAIMKVDALMQKFSEDFPSASTTENMYSHKENKEWTAGFYSGMVWLCYELTGNDKYKKFGQKLTLSFQNRIDNHVSIDFHDLGFLYTLSCVADFKLTGSLLAKETALKAADILIDRFQEKGKFIQAWGRKDDPNEYRLIIDSLLNLPLLFWATQATGDKKFSNIAYEHYKTATRTIIRPDYTTYHTFFFDKKTGTPLRGATNQGFSDDSCWSRGQAWTIYGIQLFLRYFPSEKYLEDKKFEKVLEKYKDMLGSDFIPAWDFMATEDKNLKDSSAAAIVVCGLQAYLKNESNEYYNKENIRQLKDKMLDALMTSCDSINDEQDQKIDGLLLHGVHHWPRKQGLDEAVLWGDYFYLEALVREVRNKEAFW